MVYNKMELGGVPWETLIKEYRKDIGKEKLDYLDEYADGFFKFLCNNRILFPEEHIKHVLYNILARFFNGLSTEITSNKTARKVFNEK